MSFLAPQTGAVLPPPPPAPVEPPTPPSEDSGARAGAAAAGTRDPRRLSLTPEIVKQAGDEMEARDKAAKDAARAAEPQESGPDWRDTVQRAQRGSGAIDKKP